MNITEKEGHWRVKRLKESVDNAKLYGSSYQAYRRNNYDIGTVKKKKTNENKNSTAAERKDSVIAFKYEKVHPKHSLAGSLGLSLQVYRHRIVLRGQKTNIFKCGFMSW